MQTVDGKHFVRVDAGLGVKNWISVFHSSLLGLTPELDRHSVRDVGRDIRETVAWLKAVALAEPAHVYLKSSAVAPFVPPVEM
jgi:hypothetical protein